MTDAEYLAWRFDTTRDPYRILLIDLYHETGVIHLASSPWLSDTKVPYDDWLVSEPFIEDVLGDFLGVGDIEAVNADPDLDWSTLNFRGQTCKWFFGDTAWPLSDFKSIAATLIDGMRVINGKHVRFDLMDGGQALKRTFTTTDFTSTISAVSTIEDIVELTSLPPLVIYTNVQNVNDYLVNMTVPPSETAASAIKRLTTCIGANVRFSQTGQLEVFRLEPADDPTVFLTEDDIAKNGIRMLELIPPYARVTVVMYDDTEITEATGADTGDLDETLTIQTVIRTTASAEALAEEKATYHATKHVVWEVLLPAATDLLQKGVRVSITHDELTGIGDVTRIRRAPLSLYTTAEIVI